MRSPVARWVGPATLALVLLVIASAGPLGAGVVIGGHQINETFVNGAPGGIVTDEQGDIWFTESRGNRIAHLTANNSILEYPISTPQSSPAFITRGLDDTLWFTAPLGNFIGRVMPSGIIDEFPLATPSTPYALTLGPDGNIWFTTGSNRLGRVTPSGTVSEFVVDELRFGTAITTGPDGALWSLSGGQVVRTTTAVMAQSFEVGRQGFGITTGADGALWFTQRDGDYDIGRLTTDGRLSTFNDPNSDLHPLRIVRGPEDNLWFTDESGQVLRINQAGTISPIANFGTEAGLIEITSNDIDGSLWVTQSSAERLARIAALAFDYVLLGGGGAPTKLARGADDTIWFAASGGNRVGFLRKNGSLVQHELGDGHTPLGITVAPDGRAWFVNQEANTIGVITPAGELIEYAIPTPDSFPQDIVYGPDGNFWFTELDGSKVGRITPQGVITEFPTLTPFSDPQDIAVGPDGNLWVTLYAVGKIARFTPQGARTEFPLPNADSGPWGIAAGPDNAMYFTEYLAGRIGRIAMDGLVIEYERADPNAYPTAIALGPDGAMWFTEQFSNKLGRLSRDERVTKFPLPLTDSAPLGIVGRSDGLLLFAQFNADRIAAVELAAAEPTPTPGGPTPTATPLLPVDGCVGDCDGDRVVTVAELIRGVNVALGQGLLSLCPSFDRNDDGELTINELIIAVSNVLSGCPL
jgi:streptogramin lyase